MNGEVMISPLWTGLELIAPLQARVLGVMPRIVNGVSIDTRTLRMDDLYFAIRGEIHDGHAFVRNAFEAGAAAAVVDEAHVDAVKGFGPLYVVHDVLAAMERLGQAARKRMTGMVVAVTGSVGKTSTKEAMRGVFSAFGNTHVSAASYNNHWGVPLTLARMPLDTTVGVFEIGMNHANEIRPLVQMVRPHVAVITAIAPVHLENLGSIEAVADAKAEIFEGLEAGGVAIIPRDTPQYRRLDNWARQSRAGAFLTFGETEGADARLLGFEPAADGSVVTADIMGQRLRYRLGAPGRHLASNSLALLLAARAVGMDVVDAARELSHVTAPAGRGEQIRLVVGDGDITLIDESYNANPVSMRAALQLLAEAPPPAMFGRRIAMLGDMLELGPQEMMLHAELGAVIAKLPIDLVHTVGPRMANLHDALPIDKRGLHGAAVAEVLDQLMAQVAPGDVIMIKGSNGARMGAVVSALKQRYAAAPAQDLEG
ncbi:MAG: UDP-N-acetylmuramoylalanyl-D-glutamyl-2,6-diaminopimelate--D-alanyl-D-alanyl ligase [Hyphomicrobiales bacterium]|nr:UDP-N-acetylmuramoylalanyl-D-glutamyl-2,6-diaminopimelate--D-alanyl-D-alanyl ligase [Hyphomicrobiales bacterium]